MRPFELSGQKNRTRRVAQHVLWSAPEDHFDDSAGGVSADEKQIVIQIEQLFGDFSFRSAARGLTLYIARVRTQVAASLLQIALGQGIYLGNRQHGQWQFQHRAQFRRRLHRRAGALAAVVGKQGSFDGLEFLGRDKNRPRTFARDGLSGGSQKTGGKFLVDAAMADHNQIGDFRPVANLIGDQAHIEKGRVANTFLFAARHEIFENRLAALFEDLSHLAREIQIGFKSQGAGDIVKKSSFDGDGVEYMLTEKRAVEFLCDPNRVIERRPGVPRAIERNKNVLDHT